MTALYKMINFFVAFLLLVGLVEAKKCPTDAVTSTFDNSICYIFNTTETSFKKAEKTCKSMNGHLAWIENAFENSFINGKFFFFLLGIDKKRNFD